MVQTRGIDLMLFQRWCNVYDAGPTLVEPRVSLGNESKEKGITVDSMLGLH